MVREIVNTLGTGIDMFVAAVGTGAALMGTADGLRAAGADQAIITLEPL